MLESNSAALTLTTQMIGFQRKGGGLCAVFAILMDGGVSSWRRRDLWLYQSFSPSLLDSPVASPAVATKPLLLLFSSLSAAFHAKASRRLSLKLLPTFKILLCSSGPSAPPLSMEATCLPSWPCSKLLFSRVAVMTVHELWTYFRKALRTKWLFGCKIGFYLTKRKCLAQVCNTTKPLYQKIEQHMVFWLQCGSFTPTALCIVTKQLLSPYFSQRADFGIFFWLYTL